MILFDAVVVLRRFLGIPLLLVGQAFFWLGLHIVDGEFLDDWFID